MGRQTIFPIEPNPQARNKRCHGLLIALPGVDSIARTFYQEHIANNPEVTTFLYEENEVLKAVTDTPGAVHPDTIAKRIARTTGKPGDRFLLYTEKGLFWVQYVIEPDKGIKKRVAVFDTKGELLSDRPSLDFLAALYPELVDCDDIAVSSAAALQPSLFQDAQDIIELQGSSEYFEYQYPASPAHFVGRRSLCEKLDSFANNVISKKTSCRGVLLEAPSGWGKSSLVLAWAASLKASGHFAVAIDSRSISSPRSIPYSLDYAIRRSGDFGGPRPLTDRMKPSVSFENAVQAMLEIGQSLERHGILMLIFFDQFEHIFGQHNILKHFQNLLRKVSNAQTNVVLGFSFKTGLIDSYDGSSKELPITIADLSRHIILDPFKAAETNELLEKLSDKLQETLNKDLRFHLAEFSQGYPWLLKKSNGSLDAQEFRTQTALSEKAFYRIVRDMKLLGLIKVDNGKIILKIPLPESSQDFEVAWRRHVRDRLRRHRQVRRFLKVLEDKNSLTIDEASGMLEMLCPYMSAPRQSWLTYARLFAQWMDVTDLALSDSKNRSLMRYDPATEIRERHLLLPKRSGAKIPLIQY